MPKQLIRETLVIFHMVTSPKSNLMTFHRTMLHRWFSYQPFSISGKQHGFADARGTLLDEILRIGKFHTPQVLFLENVKNYLSHANGATLTTTLECLSNAGFDVFYKVLNASNFGVPQKRERLYFVCFRKDLRIYDFSFPEPCNSDVALEDILLSPKSSTLEVIY